MKVLLERIKSKRIQLVGITIGLLLFTIPVVMLVDDFVHNVILVPIAYYIWLGSIILKALPQSCFISLLIILSIVIIIPSLRKGQRNIWHAKQPPAVVEGEVALWEKRLRLLASGAYTEQRFAYHLGHIVLQLLVFEERLPIRAVIAHLENREFDMPEEVRQYVLTGISMGSLTTKMPIKQRLMHWWKRILPIKQTALKPEQYKDILPTIKYIEERLKITEVVSELQPKEQEGKLTEVSYDN